MTAPTDSRHAPKFFGKLPLARPPAPVRPKSERALEALSLTCVVILWLVLPGTILVGYGVLLLGGAAAFAEYWTAVLAPLHKYWWGAVIAYGMLVVTAIAGFKKEQVLGVLQSLLPGKGK